MRERQDPEALQSIAPLVLRLAVGATFILHGGEKVLGGDFSGHAAQVAGLVGLPAVFGYLVGIGEFFGGLGLVFGLLTRFSAASIGLIMLGALYTHAIKFGQPFKMGAVLMKDQPRMVGWEWQTGLLAACIALVILGGGAYSADRLVRKLFKKDRA